MDSFTRTKWEGRWDQVKGRARQIWGDLTDDDMDVVEGNVEELVGKIKERTGETADVIRDRLDQEFPNDH